MTDRFAPLQAFRPGQVDLPPDQLNASKSAITITQTRAGGGAEYTTSDLLINDPITLNMSWQEIAKNFQPLGMMQHLSTSNDINLPNRPHYAASARSSSISRESEYDSQRGERAGTVEPFQGGIDLGLDFGDITAGGDISIEYGREAGVERAPSIPPSVASGFRIGGHRASSILTDDHRSVRSGTAELGDSVLGAGEVLLAANQRGEAEGLDEGPGDLGLDLGEGFDLPPLGEEGHMMDVDVEMPALEEVDAEAEAGARARRECKSSLLSNHPNPPYAKASHPARSNRTLYTAT